MHKFIFVISLNQSEDDVHDVDDDEDDDDVDDDEDDDDVHDVHDDDDEDDEGDDDDEQGSKLRPSAPVKGLSARQ